MMLGLPFLIAAVPGLIAILLTWWFKKRNFSLFLRLLPSILIICIAFGMFYIGYVNIRGFEGAAYGILAISLLMFSIVAISIATRKPHQNY